VKSTNSTIDIDPNDAKIPSTGLPIHQRGQREHRPASRSPPAPPSASPTAGIPSPANH